jgi:hypothetical protein
VNRAEKEAYLREYSVLKAQGKPFFPYAVAKDSLMAVVVMVAIILLSLTLGAELGPKADPTTTTYVPRPEWYFSSSSSCCGSSSRRRSCRWRRSASRRSP